MAAVPTPPAPPEMNTFSPGLTSSTSLERLQGGQPGQRDRRGSGEIQGAGHVRSVILVDTCLLGKGAGTILGNPGKHTIADAEPLDLAANGSHVPRQFVAEHQRQPWPQDRAHLSLAELEIHRVQADSLDVNEQFARPRRGRRDIHHQRAFGAAIVLENVSAH